MIKQLIERLEGEEKEIMGKEVPTLGHIKYTQGSLDTISLILNEVKRLQEKVRCGECACKKDSKCKHNITISNHPAPSWGMFGCSLWEEKEGEK